MRKAILLGALMGALLMLNAGGVVAQPQTPQQKIPDSYIVVFKDEARDPTALANEQARAYGLRIKFAYSNAIEGYAAVFPNPQALQRVQNDPSVAYVEQDAVVREVAQALPWGIERIDADLSSTKAGDGGNDPTKNTISDVNAYVIDSGISSHADLNLVNHVNFRGDGKNYDCDGHGTHVAGTVAAKDNTQDVVGVAPGAPLTGVKVLGCDGTGSWSGVIKGVDWVTGDANVKGPDGILGTQDDRPAIANMSLGGGASQSVDDAVRNSAASGVFYSIAAGNDGQPACNYSPARAGRAETDTNGDGQLFDESNGIVTTAATDSNEQEPSWSNYGTCVDIWAPGVNIPSTKKGSGTTTMSGTSMAAPHVGGAGALYLSSQRSATPIEVEKALKDSAQMPGTVSKGKLGRLITRLYAGSF